MKNQSLLLVVACGLAGFVWGEPTKGLNAETGRYEISVPEAEVYTLTADDVTALGTSPLEKLGDGTLAVDGVMSNFTGNIYISAGIYRATDHGSLGTKDGMTYVDGGTLESQVYGDTSSRVVGFPNETIHLKGTGFNDGTKNLGALRQTTQQCACFCPNVVLDGDTRITGTVRFDFRSTTLDMNGHTLTTAMEGNNNAFYLVGVKLVNPGHFVVEKNAFEFQSTLAGGTSTNTIFYDYDTQLQFWSAATPVPLQLTMRDRAKIWVGSGFYQTGVNNSCNIWAGRTELLGTIYDNGAVGRQKCFKGPVTGTGGFKGQNGGWLQLVCPTNSFAGGLDYTGVAAANCCVTGGVVVYANGAIPTNTANGVKLKNAQLQSFTTQTLDLPDLTADSRVVVTGDTKLVAATVKSLVKTNAGTLEIAGPFRVLGTTDIRGGTLRLASRVPACERGLDWYWNNSNGCSYTPETLNLPCQGVDRTGVGYAYKAWPYNGSGGSGNSSYNQAYIYKGYICVPGTEGETVTCNFVSSIARNTYLKIGDKVVINFYDQTDNLTKYKISAWTRFWMNGATTLTAGWQPIFLYMGNYHDATRGPQENGTFWRANFGIGVDWQGRCVTNVANYAKLLDPGDGSFLRTSLKTKDQIDPTAYRATFAGAVAFGSGTVFDLDDVAPYTPVTLPSLTGVPTITNGAVTVASSTWTLRQGDLTGGIPLTVAANASLAFPAGDVTITATGTDLVYLQETRRQTTHPILTVQEGATFPSNTFMLSAGVKAAKWHLERTGSTLSLVYSTGLTILVR